MNIRWNQEKCRFEAELGSGGFKSDLAAVKAAKWKCDGPPSWVWHSLKATPLEILRTTHRPPELTITPEAREKFTALYESEKKNAELKAQMAAANKVLKKKLKEDAQDACRPDEYFDEVLQLQCVKVEPAKETVAPTKVNFRTPEERCLICGEPLYSFEHAEGSRACLWCQKIVLDNAQDVC